MAVNDRMSVEFMRKHLSATNRIIFFNLEPDDKYSLGYSPGSLARGLLAGHLRESYDSLVEAGYIICIFQDKMADANYVLIRKVTDDLDQWMPCGYYKGYCVMEQNTFEKHRDKEYGGDGKTWLLPYDNLEDFSPFLTYSSETIGQREPQFFI